MRKLFAMAGLAAVMLLLVGAGSAAGSADTCTDAQAVGTLDLPKPAWLTDELEAQIVAAGPKGVEIARPDATVNPDCLRTAPRTASRRLPSAPALAWSRLPAAR